VLADLRRAPPEDFMRAWRSAHSWLEDRWHTWQLEPPYLQNAQLWRPIWQRRLQALRMLSADRTKVEIAEDLAGRFFNEGIDWVDRPLSIQALKVDLAPTRRRIWEPKLKKLLRGARLVGDQRQLRDLAVDLDQADGDIQRPGGGH
jgi:hypothetical protein